MPISNNFSEYTFPFWLKKPKIILPLALGTIINLSGVFTLLAIYQKLPFEVDFLKKLGLKGKIIGGGFSGVGAMLFGYGGYHSCLLTPQSPPPVTTKTSQYTSQEEKRPSKMSLSLEENILFSDEKRKKMIIEKIIQRDFSTEFYQEQLSALSNIKSFFQESAGDETTIFHLLFTKEAPKAIWDIFLKRLDAKEKTILLNIPNHRNKTLYFRLSYKKIINIEILEILFANLSIQDKAEVLRTQNGYGETILHCIAKNPNATLAIWSLILEGLDAKTKLELLHIENLDEQTVLYHLAKNQTSAIAIWSLILEGLDIKDKIDLFTKDRGDDVILDLLQGRKDNIAICRLLLSSTKGKTALFLYPAYDYNGGFSIQSAYGDRLKDYLFDVSNHYDVMIVKVHSVEEAIEALDSVDNGISLLHVYGHGPSLAENDHGYVHPSTVAFGDKKCAGVGVTPYLTVGNKEWLAALQRKLLPGSIVTIPACAIARIEKGADYNLLEEMVRYLKIDRLSVIGSMVNTKVLCPKSFTWNPDDPSEVHFFDYNSHAHKEATVKMKSLSLAAELQGQEPFVFVMQQYL